MSTPTIIKRLQIIEDLKADIAVLKEQYADALENDSQYREVQARLSEIKEETKQQKVELETKVLDKVTYTDLRNQLKEKKQELKELEEILSLELVEYYKDTGTPQVEDAKGEMKKMKFTVRLVS